LCFSARLEHHALRLPQVPHAEPVNGVKRQHHRSGALADFGAEIQHRRLVAQMDVAVEYRIPDDRLNTLSVVLACEDATHPPIRVADVSRRKMVACYLRR